MVLFNFFRRGTSSEGTARGRFCARPFETLEVNGKGDIFLCCPGWLPVSVGNLDVASPAEIWNSPKAQAIRQSILDGSYRYCSKELCPYLITGELPKFSELKDPLHRHWVHSGSGRVDAGPRAMNLSHDPTCNLACPSCRSNVIVSSSNERAVFERYQNSLLSWALSGLVNLKMAGYGDPFVSPVFRKLLAALDFAKYPQLRLTLQTNGLLLTPHVWNSLPNIRGKVKRVTISIDASSETTYAQVRRGGKFPTLLQNLQFASQLRQTGQIGELFFAFVVQQENFLEMEEFVATGIRYHADQVRFMKMDNWSTFGRREYLKRAVHLPSHPHHFQLLDHIRSSVFLHPIVNFTNLDYIARTARARLG